MGIKKNELRVFDNLYIKFYTDAVLNAWVIDFWKVNL